MMLVSSRSPNLANTRPFTPSVPGISAVPHEDNLRYFDVEIHGPSGSPYEGKDADVNYPRQEPSCLLVEIEQPCC